VTIIKPIAVVVHGDMIEGSDPHNLYPLSKVGLGQACSLHNALIREFSNNGKDLRIFAISSPTAKSLHTALIAMGSSESKSTIHRNYPEVIRYSEINPTISKSSFESAMKYMTVSIMKENESENIDCIVVVCHKANIFSVIGSLALHLCSRFDKTFERALLENAVKPCQGFLIKDGNISAWPKTEN